MRFMINSLQTFRIKILYSAILQDLYFCFYFFIYRVNLIAQKLDSSAGMVQQLSIKYFDLGFVSQGNFAIVQRVSGNNYE